VLWSPHSLLCFSQRELRTQHLSVASCERPAGGIPVSVHTTFSLGISRDELADRVERALGGRLCFSASVHDLKRAFAADL
jgi:hypothetical protein